MRADFFYCIFSFGRTKLKITIEIIVNISMILKEDI